MPQKSSEIIKRPLHRFFKIFISESNNIFRSTDGPSGSGSSRDDAERRRKKKSRWAGGDHDKTFIPGMPTILPPGMTPDQQEAYLGECSKAMHHIPFRYSSRLTEITRRNRSNGGLHGTTPEKRYQISNQESQERNNDMTCFLSLNNLELDIAIRLTAFQLHRFSSQRRCLRFRGSKTRVTVVSSFSKHR